MAEHTRGAEHAARVDLEALEAALDDGEHGLGDRLALGLALGDRADELLEIERVAAGLLDYACDEHVVGAIAEDLADELLAAAPRELVEAQLLEAALGPQAREQLVDLWACERDDKP